MKWFLDFSKQGDDSGPDAESHEEGNPVAVECSHVGSGKVTHLNLCSPIILVRVDLTFIGLVFLDILCLARQRVRETMLVS
jgi:hypothetical protein